MESEAPSAGRLVIRIKIPRGAAPVAARPSFARRALLPLILIAVAIVLTALALWLFRTEPAPAPIAAQKAPSAQPRPVAPAPAPVPSSPAPAIPAAPAPAPKLVTSEVVPDVPRSARDTISGTIRVSVRVIVAKDGAVLAAITEIPGPSRYFERLALDASRKWTFAPSDTPEQRIMLVKFNFRRSGTTASASPVPEQSPAQGVSKSG